MIARRCFAVAWIAALVAVFAYGVVGASGTKWVTQRVGWDVSSANGAGINLSSGGKDTIIIVGATNPVDSNRTVQINTSNWAWEEAIRVPYNGPSNATVTPDSLLSVALLTLTCVARTTGNRTDTIYAMPEICYGGVCGHNDIPHSGATVANSIPLVADGANKWGAGLAAATTPYTVSTGAQVVFRGWIRVDPNSTVPGMAALYMVPSFRLNLMAGGGSNGASFYASRLSITYPQRAQP